MFLLGERLFEIGISRTQKFSSTVKWTSWTVHGPRTVKIEQNFESSRTVKCWILSGTVPFLHFTVQDLWKLNQTLKVPRQWTVESYQGLFHFYSSLSRNCSNFTVHYPWTVQISQFTVEELLNLTCSPTRNYSIFHSSLSQDYQFQVLACSGHFTVEFQEFTVRSGQLLAVFCSRTVKNSQFTIQKLYILDSQWAFNHPLAQKQYKYSPIITSDQLSALPACVFGLTHEWCSWISNLEHHVLRF